MNWVRFVPTTMYLASIGSLFMAVLMVGLGLFCDSCTADDPDASVQGYLATACVYLLCSLWIGALGLLNRPAKGRWVHLVVWVLLLTTLVLVLVGILVVVEGAILADDPDGGAFMGAGVLWAVGAVSLGIAGLLRTQES